jgi:hypothetical protein
MECAGLLISKLSRSVIFERRPQAFASMLFDDPPDWRGSSQHLLGMVYDVFTRWRNHQLEQVVLKNRKLGQKVKISISGLTQNNVDHSLSITSICMLVTTRGRAA